jgi:hypothetical protein
MAASATPAKALRERGTDSGALDRERRFYAVAAFALLVITAVGFRSFLLHGKAVGDTDITQPILGLVVVHGIAMLSWVVLFFVQSLLIVTARRRLHMALGKAGAVLAAAVVLLSLIVAPLSVHFNPSEYAGLGGAKFFLALMLTGPITFGALVTVGLVQRRRPEVHRPMMLLATLVLMTGPLDRWPYMDRLVAIVHDNVPVFHYGQLLLLGALLFLLQWAMTRRANRWYAIGYAGMALVSLGSVAVAYSGVWNRLAGLIVP